MNPKFRERLQKQRDKLAASGGGDFTKYNRMQFKDGPNRFRIIEGEWQYGDGLYQVPLFQHWIKHEGKTLPFTCLCRTGLIGDDEPDVDNCPACVGWAKMARIADADGLSETTIEAAVKAKKTLSFRSSMVMNVVNRHKNEYQLLGAPQTVAQNILDIIIEACQDDRDFDVFHKKHGRDFNAMRESKNNRTEYTVTMKATSTPIVLEDDDEPSGEIVDLDKYIEDEIKSAKSEKRFNQLQDIVDSIIADVYEISEENGDDLSFLDLGAPPTRKRRNKDRDDDDRSRRRTGSSSSSRRNYDDDDDDTDDRKSRSRNSRERDDDDDRSTRTSERGGRNRRDERDDRDDDRRGGNRQRTESSRRNREEEDGRDRDDRREKARDRDEPRGRSERREPKDHDHDDDDDDDIPMDHEDRSPTKERSKSKDDVMPSSPGVSDSLDDAAEALAKARSLIEEDEDD